MKLKKCSCRRWELTGMPCKHAVAAINDMGNNGMEVGLPEAWVHNCYWLRTWEKVYNFKIHPLDGPGYWPKHNAPITLLPPKYHTQIGRPPKKRKKSAIEVEEMVKGVKLSRVGKTTRCGLCKELGHNKRTCKGQKMAPKPPASKNKMKTGATTQPPPSAHTPTTHAPSTPRPPAAKGIVIRDSPSANTRSSIKPVACTGKGKEKVV